MKERRVFPKEENVMQKNLQGCARFRELQVLPPAWKVEGKGEEREEGAGRAADNTRGEPGGKTGQFELDPQDNVTGWGSYMVR